MAADIMTWHYETPARLAMHLAHDRRFLPWMSGRGLNAFCYIRHTVDSRLKIDELKTLHRKHAIAPEYGGHVLQLLLPRERFATNPEFFPLGADKARNQKGNLCVSNPSALAIVREGALHYTRDNPECALLHLWGADVWAGAWCKCGDCAALSPQLQYMKVVNAIAAAIGEADGAPELAYLAYHDTLEPDPALRPLANVAFEWAPRERCYSHAIDDGACATNPRYFASLKRYVDLFAGRGHVFEYYADAILFGGLSLATPAIIVRDLQAYRALGLDSISCLTFGEHSVIGYPLNLETFARATQSPNFEPPRTVADVAAERHPRCAPQMIEAYRSIEHASALILDRGGEVLRPKLDRAKISARIIQLKAAHAAIVNAIAAADHIVGKLRDATDAAERELWRYNRDVVSGIIEYLAAAEKSGADRIKSSEAAIARIGAAIDHLHAAAPGFEDTWAAYDLEWIREVWLNALRPRFAKPGDESPE